MERIRFGLLDRLRMWLIATRFSCGLLRAGALRGDRLLPVGVHALVRVQVRAVGGQVRHLDLGPVLGQLWDLSALAPNLAPRRAGRGSPTPP